GVYILAIHDYGHTEDAELRLTHNTFITTPLCPLIHFAHVATPTKPLRVEASSNVFETSGIWQIVPSTGLDKLLQPAEAETATRRALAWHGRENLYAVANFMQWHDKGPAHGPKNLADWKKFWGQTETDAREGPLRYYGGNLTSRLTAQVVDKITMPLGKFTLDDFRLRPDSAGYRAGKDGKDLGADVDLVGPGPAYERWKQTPEYQQWLKDT